MTTETLSAKELRSQHAAIVDRRGARIAAAEKAGRDFNAEETTADAADMASAAALAARIKRIDDFHKSLNDLGAEVNPPEIAPGPDGAPRVDTQQRLHSVRVIPEYIVRPMKNFPNTPQGYEEAYRCGKWIQATLLQSASAHDWCIKNGIDRVHMFQSEGTNTAGGYLTLPEFERAIIILRDTFGAFRRNAQVIPMGAETMFQPRLASGLTAYWTTEANTSNTGGDTTESSIGLDQIELVSRELSALAIWSLSLDQDAVVSLADTLAREIAVVFAYKEDLAGFNGDGTSTYGHAQGATVKINNGSYANSISTSATGHTGTSTLTMADFHGVQALLPEYVLNPKWYCTRAFFAAAMQRLMYAVGGNTVDTLAGGSQQQFLGAPVEFVGVMNRTLTAQTATIMALYGDLSMSSMIGVRKGISLAVSRERYFEKRALAILGWERVAINNHSFSSPPTLTASSGGPVIALKMAAS